MLTPSRSQTFAVTPVLVTAFALGAVIFGVAAHVVNPHLSPGRAPISDLAQGRHGWLMTLSFVTWGLATLTTALALWRGIPSRWPRAASLLVAGAGMGPLLAAAFPADPMTAPAGAATTSGMLHAVGAMLSDLLLPASLVLVLTATRRGQELFGQRHLVRLATLVLWAAAIALTVAMASSPHPGNLSQGTPLGWFNRVHVVTCLAFLAASGSARAATGTR